MSEIDKTDKIRKIICKIELLQNIERIDHEDGFTGLRFYLDEIREELDCIISE